MLLDRLYNVVCTHMLLIPDAYAVQYVHQLMSLKDSIGLYTSIFILYVHVLH